MGFRLVRSEPPFFQRLSGPELTARSGHDGNVYNWNDRRTGNCVAGAQGKASSSQAKLPSVQRPQASGIDQPAWND
jgi:hypothetical protein